jgi:hypothetical protein
LSGRGVFSHYFSFAGIQKELIDPSTQIIFDWEALIEGND